MKIKFDAIAKIAYNNTFPTKMRSKIPRVEIKFIPPHIRKEMVT